MSKKLVTKVDIVVSDDAGKCDPSCPFLKAMGPVLKDCTAFDRTINADMKRTVGCMGREDCTYQIPVVEE